MRAAWPLVHVALACALVSCSTLIGLEEAHLEQVRCGQSVSVDPERLKTCVLELSCDPLLPLDTISNCVMFGPFYSCANGAQACEQVTSCIGHRREDASVCAASETGWKCLDNRAVHCQEGGPYSIDCTVADGTCDVSVVESNSINWPCRTNTPATCSGVAGEFACSGSDLYQCIGGVPYGYSCAPYGACAEGSCNNHTATCPAEVTSNTQGCAGNVLQICDDSRGFLAADCAVSGGTCGVANNRGYCLSPGCDKSDYDLCEESCASASRLRLCVGGAPLEVDCTAYGFNKCALFHDHLNTGLDYVACQ